MWRGLRELPVRHVRKAIEFNYKVIRSRRRTLCVEVRSDVVIVRSPLLLPEFAINAFLKDKQKWIFDHLENIKKQSDCGKLFLGRRVEIIFGEKDFIKSNQIGLKALGHSEIERNTKLEKFYRSYSEKLVREFLAKYSPHFQYGRIKFQKYRSRWGSCSPKNDLNFNSRLAMCPVDVVEYIVVHELCHTRVKNHSRHFYDEVQKYLPSYRQPLKWLRQNRGLI